MAYKEMKTYFAQGNIMNFEYFWDINQKLWILYPIDNLGNRIESDENDNPIEAMYFNNKKELTNWLKILKQLL